MGTNTTDPNVQGRTRTAIVLATALGLSLLVLIWNPETMAEAQTKAAVCGTLAVGSLATIMGAQVLVALVEWALVKRINL